MVATVSRIADYRLRHVWSTGTDADTSEFDDVQYETPPGVVIDGIGRSQARAFGPPSTPALDDTLPNLDGRYAPGGILGLFVGRGPETTFDADWGADQLGDAPDIHGDARNILGDGTATTRLFTGAITTAPQDIGRATANVQIRSLGSIASLARKKPTTILYESVRTDIAFGYWLDACGWPADKRRLDAGDTILTYFWGDGRTDGVTGLNNIVAAEGVPSCWYVDQDGVAVFEGRQYRASARRSTEIQWTFFDGSRGGGNPLGDSPFLLGDDPNTFGDGPAQNILYHVLPTTWGSNPDEVVASVQTTVNVRTPSALPTKFWEYGGPLTIGALQTVDIPITSSVPFKNAITPAPGTDYAISGPGSLTAVSLLTNSGTNIVLRLTAGASGAIVIGVTSNGPQVRATMLPVTSELPIASTVDVALSSARFEPKDYTISLYPEIAPNVGLDRVNNFARRYQKPRDQMTITLANLDADHLAAILSVRISDRVRVIHTHGNIAASFFVETIRHDLSNGGGLHLVTLGLERVTDDIPARFGIARFDFDAFSE